MKFEQLKKGEEFMCDGLLFVKTHNDRNLSKIKNNAICRSKRIPCYVENETEVTKVQKEEK